MWILLNTEFFNIIFHVYFCYYWEWKWGMGSVCVYMYVYTTSKPQEKGIQNVMESFKKVVPGFPCSCSLLLMVCFPNVSSFFSLQKKKNQTHFFVFLFLSPISSSHCHKLQRDPLSRMPSCCWRASLPVDRHFHTDPCFATVKQQCS